MSYAAAASAGNSSAASGESKTSHGWTRNREEPILETKADQKRVPSPSHVPNTETEDENVYVLTLQTDKAHHRRMTELRNQYFPPKLNKLAAHLTLFHALPGSKLNSYIIPTIEDVTSKTSPFRVHAIKPFRLKYGIAISVAKENGAKQAQNVHHALQQSWLDENFLSDQDRGGMRAHYTILNKVDNQGEIDKAFNQVQSQFKGDFGVAEGLGLYRYDRGKWKFVRKFEFQA